MGRNWDLTNGASKPVESNMSGRMIVFGGILSGNRGSNHAHDGVSSTTSDIQRRLSVKEIPCGIGMRSNWFDLEPNGSAKEKLTFTAIFVQAIDVSPP